MYNFISRLADGILVTHMNKRRQIVIDYELWKKLKLASARTEKSLKQLVEEAVEKYLDEVEKVLKVEKMEM